MSSISYANGTSNKQTIQEDQRKDSSSNLALRITNLASFTIFGSLAVLFTATAIVSIFFTPLIVPIISGALATATGIVAFGILLQHTEDMAEYNR